MRKEWILLFICIIIGLIVTANNYLSNNNINGKYYSAEVILEIKSSNSVKHIDTDTSFEETRDNIVKYIGDVYNMTETQKTINEILEDKCIENLSEDDTLYVSGNGRLIILKVSGFDAEKSIIVANTFSDYVISKINSILQYNELQIMQYASINSLSAINIDEAVGVFNTNDIFSLCISIMIGIILISLLSIFDKKIISEKDFFDYNNFEYVGKLFYDSENQNDKNCIISINSIIKGKKNILVTSLGEFSNEEFKCLSDFISPISILNDNITLANSIENEDNWKLACSAEEVILFVRCAKDKNYELEKIIKKYHSAVKRNLNVVLIASVSRSKEQFYGRFKKKSENDI